MTAETEQQPAAATPPAISDDEIRDWANATGRAAGARGRVSAALRREYEGIARQLGDPAAAAEPGGQADADATTTPAAQRPAKEETRPRRVDNRGRKPARSRIRSFFAGEPASSSKSKSKSKAEPKPRTPVDKFAGKLWGYVAGGMEHINVPVARCMAWQSPFVGAMAEDAIKNTFLDRIIQPIARGEEKLTTAAAVIAMPFIVAALQNPANQPTAGLAGVARFQILSTALEEAIDAQLEAFGSGPVAEQILRDQAEREERKDSVNLIMAMIFADLPDPKTAAEADKAAAEESARRREANAATYGPVPPPGATVIPGTAMVVDNRGQAAQDAAARIAEAGQAAAAAAQRSAVANVQLGTARL